MSIRPIIRDAYEDEIPRIVQLLLRSETLERQVIVRNGLEEALTESFAAVDSLAWHRVLTYTDQILGATVGKRIGGGAALLLGARVMPAAPLSEFNDRNCIQMLWNDISGLLKSENLSFIQALRAPNDSSPFLAQADFRLLANLEYHAVDPQQIPNEKTSNLLDAASIRFGSAAELTDEQLFEVLEKTYEGSLDCPAFVEYRSVTEVVQSYRLAKNYRIGDWYVLYDHDKPLGCLMLTNHAESAICEITYMGVVPNARGVGHGARIIKKAAQISRNLGIEQLVLAVDQANHPAIKLYQNQGFRSIFAESVWGRRL